jgi:hypothetical protein
MTRERKAALVHRPLCEHAPQRFGAVVLPHHDQQASENGDGKHSSFCYNASAAIPAANHSDFFNTHISYLSCGLSMLTSDETRP